MRTVILFLAAVRVYGFAVVMEHPQLPSWMPQAPSWWKLPELKLLAKAGGTECVHLDQCCCGTPWKKPMGLFAVGIPELGRLVAKLPGGGRCCPALGHKHVSLPGKGEGGVYRTAPAKTYNSVMCKVLADATFGSIARFLSGLFDVMAAERGLPPEIAMLHVPIDHDDPESWTAWTGRMISPEHPLESRRLPIHLALGGTRSRTGCALPSPSPSLPPRPIRRPQRAWK